MMTVRASRRDRSSAHWGVCLVVVAGASLGCLASEGDTEEAPSATYINRVSFEDETRGLTEINFSDVALADEPVLIEADRYSAQGIILTGTSGQYVDDDFGYPDDYPAVSGGATFSPGPNTYDGPIEPTTVVTFTTASGTPGATSAFGVFFIDADFTASANSTRLTAYDAFGDVVGEMEVSGDNGEAVFAGVRSINDSGDSVANITRVELVTGDGWPGSSEAEGVVLDEFVFAPVE